MGLQIKAKTTKNQALFNFGRPPEGAHEPKPTYNRQQLTSTQPFRDNTIKTYLNIHKKFHHFNRVKDNLMGKGSGCSPTQKDVPSARAKSAPRRSRPRERFPAKMLRLRRGLHEVPGTQSLKNDHMAETPGELRLWQATCGGPVFTHTALPMVETPVGRRLLPDLCGNLEGNHTAPPKVEAPVGRRLLPNSCGNPKGSKSKNSASTSPHPTRYIEPRGGKQKATHHQHE